MLRHLAFLEALSTMEDGTPDWHATSAGLVTLRLVDGWLARGGFEPGADRWGIGAVRGAIAAVTPGDPSRAILTGIADVVDTAGPACADQVAPRLMAYARKLDFGGQWTLAADVYEMVLSFMDATRDADLAVDANFRLAYCRRVLGDLEVAERAYVEAGRIAGTIADPVSMLRSEVGVAKVAIARGNHPLAERLIESVIQRADAALLQRELPRMRDFRATALHDRAIVALERHQYELGIQLLNTALPDTASPSARDRVLADIASGFMHLGVRSAARDAFLVVAATAEEQFSRWSATTNLISLAAYDGMEPVFEQYRRQLADAPLTPELEAYYHYVVGEGYALFGKERAARAALDRAVAICERHGFNRILFLAEQQRTMLDSGIVASRRGATPVPVSVAGVADTMRELREATLVGA